MTNTRKIGDAFEKRVLEILGPYFRETAGSGSIFKDQDFVTKTDVVEVKVKSTSGASVAGKELNKLKTHAKKEGKEWVFICENTSRDIVVMLDIHNFVAMHEAERML